MDIDELYTYEFVFYLIIFIDNIRIFKNIPPLYFTAESDLSIHAWTHEHSLLSID